MKLAKCSGCGITSDKLSEYNEDDPVTSYENGKFVCGECYDKLISMRIKDFKPDVGTPFEVQMNAMKYLKP
jgi:hypothetical protein